MIEGKWIAAFVEALQLCGVQRGDACAVLAETQSRPVLVQCASLALQQLGASSFVLTLPTPPVTTPVPVRSTGASAALAGQGAAVAALAHCTLVVDCTVEGLQHAAELPRILAGGARVLVVSNEHPEILERCLPRAEDEAPVRDAMRLLKAARRMAVHSKGGTELEIDLQGARIGGVWGFTRKRGTLTHWPAGLVLAFPADILFNVLVLDLTRSLRNDNRVIRIPFAENVSFFNHHSVFHKHVCSVRNVVCSKYSIGFRINNSDLA